MYSTGKTKLSTSTGSLSTLEFLKKGTRAQSFQLTMGFNKQNE